MALSTPLPARSRAGSLRKEPTSRSSDSRKAAAGYFATPIRSRAGAKLLEVRGFTSATPAKDGRSMRAATIKRAASYSPRALLEARAKGTSIRRERTASSAPAPAARAALPRPTLMRFARMESYKQRDPTDIKLPPIPRPIARTKKRESGVRGQKTCKSSDDENSSGNAFECYSMPVTDEKIRENQSVCDRDSFGIRKFNTKGGKAYTNGKPHRYAMLKKAYERSTMNG